MSLACFAIWSICLAGASAAAADDMLVDGPATNTQTIDGDDTITVTPGGSITPPAGNDAILGTGSNNTAINNGSIQTSGGGEGIFLDNGTGTKTKNVIINNGSVITNGTRAYGLHTDLTTNSAITNNGSVTSTGVSTYGLYLEFSDDSVATNNGSVTVVGTNVYGIYIDNVTGSSAINNGTISMTNTDVASANAAGILIDSSSNLKAINRGSITSSGFRGYGIWSDRASDSIISNEGSINTSGSEGHGIYSNSSHNTSVINSGRVQTSGPSAYGIYSHNSNDPIVANSGYVVSEISDSIRMDNTSGGVLNLNAPSYLGGAMTFVTSTTLNVKSGPSHSIYWQLPTSGMAGSAPNLSGPVPFFYDPTTQKLATFDPTRFAAGFNQLGDMAAMFSRLGEFGLDQTERQRNVNQGEGPATVRFWMTGIGESVDHDGDASTLTQSIKQHGAALGYNWQQSTDLWFGVMAGYLNGEITAASPFTTSQDIESEAGFAGVYGKQRFGLVTVGFGFAGGWQSMDGKRFVNDNLATTGGLTLGQGSSALSSYDAWFLVPEGSIAADVALGGVGNLVLTPKLRVSYAYQQVDGYSESGAKANADVADHTLGVFETNLELAGRMTFDRVTVTGRVGYFFRSSVQDDHVSVTLCDITNSIQLGDTERSAAYLGASADFALSEDMNLVVDAQKTLSTGDAIEGIHGAVRLVTTF